MVGPALIGFVANPIVAILCFSLGGFAHQMLSSMMYALMGDVVEKPEVATATGVAGMFGYLGGALFTLMVGALASTLGYEPLFAMLFLFDVVAAAGAVGLHRRTQARGGGATRILRGLRSAHPRRMTIGMNPPLGGVHAVLV